MNRYYAHVAMRAGKRCEYCRAPESIFNFPFEVEHITPTALGGTDSEENLALACRACNLFKSDRANGVDPETAEEVRLYHPREDKWQEHFLVDAEGGKIGGRTSIGRGTVHCLKMNSDDQVQARRQWVRLGLFP